MIDDAIDDPINTLRVLETAHGPGSAADFSKSTLYGIGSANLMPMSLRAAKEAQ